MKYKRLIRRLGAAVLSVSVLLTGAYTGAAQTAETVGDTPALFQKGSYSTAESSFYSDDDRVRIVVELEEDPLLDADLMSSYASLSDYLEGDEAQSAEKELEKSHKAVINEIEMSLDDAEVEYEYSAVLNGLAVEADYGDLEDIQSLPGVKDAFVSQRYELIEPVAETTDASAELQASGSLPSIGGDTVQESGYTGKDTVVAILDTGLDVDHEAFSGAVNGAKYSKSDIEGLINSNSLNIGKLNVNSVYQSEKIPFAYDYYANDTNVDGGNSHGTHVAGIAGANAGKVTGVAPDAQLFIMKIFGDDGSGAYDSDILAALDDSIKLGADAVNMSLGMTSGFSQAAEKKMQQVYQRVKDAGVNLMCAAGNEYSSAYQSANGGDLPLASNPDNGTVASPSTYSAAMSVASMNNTETTSAYMLVGSDKIRYNDTAEDTSMQIASFNGTYEYVVCGYGATTDFTGSLSGKIALVQRGGEENGEILTFAQKEANAAAAGAKAIIVYDNVTGSLVNMSTNDVIPAVFISKANGELMAAAADKRVSFSKEYVDQFSDSYSGKMSDFSSWGVTPDLKLKPEITAPGGDIYSSLPGGTYGNMSGTSMASPHMAGAAAVMNQYIKQKLDGSNKTQSEISDLADKLMMSTAVPVKDENDIPYSPRKQGAGLLQLQNAVAAGAYLTSADSGLPKAETGANEAGSFSFSFKANNLGSSSIKYQTSVTVLTEATTVSGGKTYMAQSPRVLSSDEVAVTVPDTVTVSGNGTATVNISVKLTEKGKAALDKDFPNGIYIEGFVTLTPVSGGEAVNLGLPFMGFYGDWTAAPIFDASIYDEDAEPAVYSTRLGKFDSSTGGGYYLGGNSYVSGRPYDAERIAFSNETQGYNVTAAMAMLRNADTLTFTVINESGETVYTETSNSESKTYYSSSQNSYHTPMAAEGFTGYIKNKWTAAQPLPEGNYTYKVTATLNGKSETEAFPIVIDNEDPQILKSEIVTENGKRLWKVTVSDNHYVQAVCATLGSTPLTGWVEPEADEAGQQSVVTFDLSDAAFSGLTQAKIALTDYADNQVVSEYYSLEGGDTPSVQPTSVELDKTQLLMETGDSTTLSANVLPANAYDRTVSWSSSAADVAAVDKNGKVTAHAEGTAVITAKTVNGLTAECTVSVTAKQPADDRVLASVQAPSAIQPGEVLPVDFQLENLKRVATVSFTFEKEESITDGTVEGKSGFTALGSSIRWNGNSGVLMLSYLKDGERGSSLTREALTDIARVTLSTAAADNEKLGIRLTGVTVSGYDSDGKAVILASGIKTQSVSVTVRKAANYDVNGDGVVDQLDITTCQAYYQAKTGDSDWSAASKCDVNSDGRVDIEDMILILQYIYK